MSFIESYNSRYFPYRRTTPNRSSYEDEQNLAQREFSQQTVLPSDQTTVPQFSSDEVIGVRGGDIFKRDEMLARVRQIELLDSLKSVSTKLDKLIALNECSSKQIAELSSYVERHSTEVKAAVKDFADSHQILRSEIKQCIADLKPGAEIQWKAPQLQQLTAPQASAIAAADNDSQHELDSDTSSHGAEAMNITEYLRHKRKRTDEHVQLSQAESLRPSSNNSYGDNLFLYSADPVYAKSPEEFLDE